MDKKTIGIIGCGVIGSALVEYAQKELTGRIEKIILYDCCAEKLSALAKKVSGAVIAGSIDEVAIESDIIVEAATPKIVAEVLQTAISLGKDVMIMSVGGLLENEEALEKARAKNVKILVPSGAIAGIDAIKAAKKSGIESATITTRKPPKSIKGAPYLL